MSQWLVVSRKHHAEQGYTPRRGYHQTQGQMVMAVVVSELAKLLPHYVLGFLRSGESVAPVAVLGLAQDQNLYLHHDGRWLAAYVPAAARGYPFALADHQAKQKVLVLAKDHLDANGAPLFNGEELSPQVADTFKFLSQYQQARSLTAEATQTLEEVGLLKEWQLTVPVGDSHKAISGLLRVDEQALNALNADTYARLQGAPMQLAYAQLYSMAQVNQLTLRAELDRKLNQAEQSDVDLEDLFGDEDDNLDFNF
jgi:hypothetical protein